VPTPIDAAQNYTSGTKGFGPTKEQLAELRQWLNQKPECSPNCVAITAAQISFIDQQMQLLLTVDVHAASAFKLPTSERWQISRVLVDQQPQSWVAQKDQNQWLFVEAGRHTVSLQGSVAGLNRLSIEFPKLLQNLSMTDSRWELEGVRHGTLQDKTLGLIRKAQQDKSEITQLVESVEPMVRIIREFELGDQWYLTTSVERIAPMHGAINLDLPLYEWEQVTSANANVRDKVIRVHIPAGDNWADWRSLVPYFSELQLTAFDQPSFVEEWYFSVAHQWNMGINGIPQTWPDSISDYENWRFRYLPRANETLNLSVAKPLPVKGADLVFEQLTLAIKPGKQQQAFSLVGNYQSSRGGQGQMKVGSGEQLDASLDNKKVYLQIRNGEVDYPIKPGGHSLDLSWKQNQPFSFRYQMPKINTNSPVSNINVKWQVPRDRWVLWASGPTIGPAIIYWGELLAFLVIAFLLSRAKLLPVSTISWLLLGLGLSTQSWAMFIATTVWLFGLSWWQSNKQGFGDRWFNFIQVALVVVSVLIMLSLISSVPMSLLSQPDMGIVGNQSSGYQLNWYHDRSQGDLPNIVVYSLPMWVYKLAMLMWSLWLASMLLKWSKWSWQVLADGGMVRKSKPSTNTAGHASSLGKAESGDD
jgi:hypothetical protein